MLKILLLFVLFALNTVFFSQEKNRKAQFNLESGLALQGFDPVSYFLKKPLEGKKNHSFNYKNVTYYFANEANLKTFKNSPDKYEPQFGGWCAYAMGKTGEKVEVDPETYKIIDDKLYLFYNSFFNNTLSTWNKDEKSLKAKADKNWIKFIKNN